MAGLDKFALASRVARCRCAAEKGDERATSHVPPFYRSFVQSLTTIASQEKAWSKKWHITDVAMGH